MAESSSSSLQQYEQDPMKVAEEEEFVDFGAEIPDDLRGLVACLRCSLIKTFRQFDEGGCENCEFLGMKDNTERVTQCTTSYHEGCIAMIDATPYHMSDDVGVRAPWVARWNRIESFVPGMYAIKMTGQLPEDMIELCDQEGIEIKPSVTYDGKKSHNVPYARDS